MAVYNSHNTKQWNELINAINGGDTSAIATALTTIKTSIDSVTTALSSLSAEVDVDSTQWTNLITAINTGNTSAIATALANIKSSIDNIYNRLNSVGFNTTQWTNLVNAITNQSLTVDLSNVTSSVVSNLSDISGSTITDALNALNSTLTATYQNLTLGYFSGYIIRLGKLRIISLYNGTSDQAPVEGTLDAIDKPVANVKIGAWVLIGSNTYGSRFLYLDTNGKLYTDSSISRGGFTLVYIAQ